MTRDAWLAGHPYLQPIADVREAIDDAAARVTRPVVESPDWQAYLPDYHAGIPLLQSELAGIGVPDPLSVVHQMLDELARRPLSSWLADQCRELRADPQPQHAMFRCLLWAVLARDLAPVLSAFAQWRNEERWLRNYCPACGAAPAMAQLPDLSSSRRV